MVSDEVVIQLADKLAIPASEIFNIMVSAQATLVYIYALSLLLIIGTAAVFYTAARLWVDDDMCPHALVAVMGALIGVVLYAVVYRITTSLFIPEYVAIVHLAELLVP